jgi:hypothetical protein
MKEEDVDENELSDDDSSNWLQYIVANYIFWFLSPVLVSLFFREEIQCHPPIYQWSSFKNEIYFIWMYILFWSATVFNTPLPLKKNVLALNSEFRRNIILYWIIN